MQLSLGYRREKITGVIRVSVDDLQKGDFRKSRFPKATFGW